MIKMLKSFLDEDGTVKARMEDFPPEAFRTVYGEENDRQRKLIPISRKCLNYRANAVTEIPFQFEYNDKVIYSSESKDNSGSEELINFINLLRSIEISLIRWGRAYIHIDSMRIMPSYQMSFISDKETKEIIGYKQKIGLKETSYDAEEIIYIHETSDQESEPIQSIIDTIDFDVVTLNNIDRYISSYFSNGAIKSTIITVDGFPMKEEVDRLEKHLDRVVKGVKNAFKNIVLRLPITPVVIGSGLEGFDPVLTQNKILDIVTAFEIPPSLVLANAANYATALSDKKEFYSSVISPRCRLIATAANDQWLNLYGYQLTFMPEKHSLFAVDETVRSQSLLNLINSGIDLVTSMEILGYDLTDEQRSRIEQSVEDKKMSGVLESANDKIPDDLNSGEIIVTKSYSIY